MHANTQVRMTAYLSQKSENQDIAYQLLAQTRLAVVSSTILWHYAVLYTYKHCGRMSTDDCQNSNLCTDLLRHK